MIKSLKKDKGLTLIEIIVSLAILGIIVTPLFTLFTASIKNNAYAKDKLIANQVAQEYMEKARNDLNSSELIKDSYIDSKSGFVKFSYPNNDPSSGFDITTYIEEHTFKESTDDKKEISYQNNIGSIIANDDIDTTIESDTIGTIKCNPSIPNVKIEGNTISILKNINLEPVNIKIACDHNMDEFFKTETDKVLKILNKSDKRVNIYKIYSDSKNDKILIQAEDQVGDDIEVEKMGAVYVYENVYDGSKNINKYKNRVCKIKVTVKKEDKPVAELVTFKTID